jgi:hypothetical protein
MSAKPTNTFVPAGTQNVISAIDKIISDFTTEIVSDNVRIVIQDGIFMDGVLIVTDGYAFTYGRG